MAGVDSFLQNFLAAYLFVNSAEVTTQVKSALTTHSGLHLAAHQVTDTDGRLKQMLTLTGTLDVIYKGGSYNIPITVHLSDTYPYNPPQVVVVPTPDMLIKPGPHVQSSGAVSLPYLSKWTPKSSTLDELLSGLQVIFGESPPVYARPTLPTSTTTGTRSSMQYTHRPTQQPSLPPKPGARADLTPPRLKPKPTKPGLNTGTGATYSSTIDTQIRQTKSHPSFNQNGIHYGDELPYIQKLAHLPSVQYGQQTHPNPSAYVHNGIPRVHSQSSLSSTSRAEQITLPNGSSTSTHEPYRTRSRPPPPSTFNTTKAPHTANANTSSKSYLYNPTLRSEDNNKNANSYLYTNANMNTYSLINTNTDPKAKGLPNPSTEVGLFGNLLQPASQSQPQSPLRHKASKLAPSASTHGESKYMPEHGELHSLQPNIGPISDTSSMSDLIGLNLSSIRPCHQVYTMGSTNLSVQTMSEGTSGSIKKNEEIYKLGADVSTDRISPPMHPILSPTNIPMHKPYPSTKLNGDAHLVNNSLLDMDIARSSGPDDQKLRLMRITKKLENRIENELSKHEKSMAKYENEQLQRKETLTANSAQLDSMVNTLQIELQKVQNNTLEYKDCLAEIDETLGLYRNRTLPSIDDMVVTRYALSAQLMRLVAEVNAIEDTFHYLLKALNRDSINFDHYLKAVRILSRHQFMTRALIIKVEEAHCGAPGDADL
eukprot:CFRG4250T1